MQGWPPSPSSAVATPRPASCRPATSRGLPSARESARLSSVPYVTRRVCVGLYRPVFAPRYRLQSRTRIERSCALRNLYLGRLWPGRSLWCKARYTNCAYWCPTAVAALPSGSPWGFKLEARPAKTEKAPGRCWPSYSVMFRRARGHLTTVARTQNARIFETHMTGMDTDCAHLQCGALASRPRLTHDPALCVHAQVPPAAAPAGQSAAVTVDPFNLEPWRCQEDECKWIGYHIVSPTPTPPAPSAPSAAGGRTD